MEYPVQEKTLGYYVRSKKSTHRSDLILAQRVLMAPV